MKLYKYMSPIILFSVIVISLITFSYEQKIQNLNCEPFKDLTNNIIVGKVKSIVQKTPGKYQIVFNLSQSEGVNLLLNIDKAVYPGSELNLNMRVRRLDYHSDYYHSYLKPKLICGVGEVTDYKLIHASSWYSENIVNFRTATVRILVNNFDNNVAGLISGLLIGDISYLEKATQDNFKALGLTHLVAVSGANFIFVVGLFGLLLQIFPKKISLVINIVIAFAYIQIVGITNLAAYRAFVFFVILQLQLIFGRKLNLINSLMTSLLVISVSQPGAYRDLGFQLSMSAWFLVKVILVPILTKLVGLTGVFFDEVVSSFFGSLILLPVSIYFFDEVNIISPFVNAIVVPVMGLLNLISVLNLSLSLFSTLHPVIYRFMEFPFIRTIDLINNLVGFIYTIKSDSGIFLQFTLLLYLIFISVSLYNFIQKSLDVIEDIEF